MQFSPRKSLKNGHTWFLFWILTPNPHLSQGRQGSRPCHIVFDIKYPPPLRYKTRNIWIQKCQELFRRSTPIIFIYHKGAIKGRGQGEGDKETDFDALRGGGCTGRLFQTIGVGVEVWSKDVHLQISLYKYTCVVGQTVLRGLNSSRAGRGVPRELGRGL